MPGASLMSVYPAIREAGILKGLSSRHQRWSSSGKLNVVINFRGGADTSHGGRDVQNWQEVEQALSESSVGAALGVRRLNIGELPLLEQVRLSATTDVFLMHHGAANNHRFWMELDSLFLETQPPGEGWFCGHAFGKDGVNYVLVTTHSTKVGECNSARPPLCRATDCPMYTLPKSFFVTFKDKPVKLRPQRIVALIESAVAELTSTRSPGAFRLAINAFSRQNPSFTRIGCRGHATQLADRDAFKSVVLPATVAATRSPKCLIAVVTQGVGYRALQGTYRCVIHYRYAINS
jgi:hypothetical protein